MISPKIALNLQLDVETNRLGSEPITLRAYLKELTKTVWTEGEGFEGKRAFGNSGWQADLGRALIEAGMEDLGEVDYYGDIQTLDWPKLDKFIQDCIDAL